MNRADCLKFDQCNAKASDKTHVVFQRALAPFGRKLYTDLKAGRRPVNCVFCFVGTGCWKFAKHHSHYQAVLVLPPGDAASDYYWPVRGLDCLVARVGEATKREILLLTRELLAAGARRITIILVQDLFGRSPIIAASKHDGC